MPENYDLLKIKPVPLVKSEVCDNSVVLLLPRFSSGFLGKFLQPRLPEDRSWIKVKLEARGATVWKAINKGMNVCDIIKEFVVNHPDDKEEASDRVWQYLKHMQKNGMIEL